MRLIPFIPNQVQKNQAERLSRLAKVGGWPCNTLGNHDAGHYLSCFEPQLAPALARLHTAALLTLRGTPFIYNGDEIGMDHLTLEKMEDVCDVFANWVYDNDIQVLHLTPEEAMVHAARTTRDKGRTPMQWQNDPQAGFCPANGKPWLPVNPNYARGINVADQENDPDSLLNFHRRLIRLRHEFPAMVNGEQIAVHPRSRDTLAFLRKNAAQTILVLLQFKNKARRYHWKATAGRKFAQARILFSLSGQPLKRASLTLEPYDIVILELTN